MTRIDFYLNAESKLQFACRIAAKAFRQKLRVAIFSSDEIAARTIDNLIWSTPQTGFVPHCRAKSDFAGETPVLIVEKSEPAFQSDLLVNLDAAPPPQFGRYSRLIEIVSRDDEADQKAARERYRFYKDRGYALIHHDLLLLASGAQGGR